jgi:hypothetical protein
MMPMRIVCLSLALLAAAPAFAQDVCDDLWFTRNLIFDRAGYCFESTLGQAVFDNAGCKAGDPALTAEARNQVAAIQATEQELGCAVDTSRRALNVLHLDRRMAMIDIPVPSLYESGCYGWRGAPITLRAGRSDTAPVTGQIPSGGDIYWSFEGPDGWSFVIDQYGGPDMGWFREVTATADMCETNAG